MDPSLLASLPAILATSADLTLVTDARGRLLFSNTPSFTDTANRVLAECVPPPAAGPLRELQARALASLTPVTSVIGGLLPGQSDTWMLVRCVRLPAPGGGEWLVHVALDMSEGYLEEQRLRHLEELMIDNEGIAHYGVWEWDITQPHASWTRGLYKIYGLTPETYTPTYEAYLKLVHPDDRQRVMDATNKVFHQHEPYSHDERIHHSSGGIRYLHTWAVPVLKADGTLKALKGVCLDITERKLAEIEVAEQAEELRRLNEGLEARVRQRTAELEAANEALRRAKEDAENANRAKSAFVANMSHELRTPMNAIIGFTTLALKPGAEARHRDYLGKIRTASHALLTIINDILDLSKIEAGQMLVERREFALQPIMDRIADLCLQRAAERDVELIMSLPATLPATLLGDALRLEQVLLNLTGNAIKFTQHGEVYVSVAEQSRDDGHVRLRFGVHDSGIGLSEEQIGRLFRPFSQADVSTTRRFGGTGLGLNICKHLVELLGGEIGVESQPGAGSTFWFSLPLGVGTSAAQAKSALGPGGQRGLRRVLLADDNAHAREVYGEMLKSFALDVIPVDGGVAAVDAARAANVDLALLDWKMPGMDGVEAARRLRALKRGLPVILMTAFSSDDALLRSAASAGISTILYKPVKPSDLFDAIMNSIQPGATAPVPAEPVPAAEGDALRGARLLLVEDNSVNQEIAVEVLSSLGARVEVANDGAEAVAAAGANLYHAILMDIQMPEMNGFEATRRIRAGKRHAAVPIIGMSASALADERRQGLAAGMDDYVTKPIEVAQLVAALRPHVPAGGNGAATPAPARPVPAAATVMDEAEALQRLRGNRVAYRKLLEQFAALHGGDASQIRADLARNDRTAARVSAHRLQGVAGNLSLKQLQAAAAALDRKLAQLNSDVPEAEMMALEQAVPAALAAVREAAQRYLPTESPTVISLAPAELGVVLRQLDLMLLHQDMSAEDQLEVLGRSGMKGEAGTRLGAVQNAFEQFDFTGARQALGRLAAHLDVRL